MGPHNQPQRFANRDQQLAYYVNAYNALAMYNVLRSGIPDKFSFLDRFDFFWRTQFVIGGRSLSLYDFENDVIRPLGDPRVHFALNCMVRSCPRLPRVPFRAETLNAQLNQAARLFFNEPRNVRVDAAYKTVYFSSILDFYTSDFLKLAPSLIAYVNYYRQQSIPDDYTVRFIDYDWTLNRQMP